ncbi:Com family DNA-binding transcriptional regulator [Shewanella algae]|uniref:Com family DNA-binding transcriptional regulator n=1 Tax=Shewanella algae TaxID=38313 RepID=UPI0011874C65|nr:Com family DNA-binding transcriptional regulator [Shewanella algae]MBO2635278.1 Com family DNA-binding transcriptional regulator [Shewanella algae]
MTEFRCIRCTKLLARIQGQLADIEIKCPRCKHLNQSAKSTQPGNLNDFQPNTDPR